MRRVLFWFILALVLVGLVQVAKSAPAQPPTTSAPPPLPQIAGCPFFDRDHVTEWIVCANTQLQARQQALENRIRLLEARPPTGLTRAEAWQLSQDAACYVLNTRKVATCP